MVIKNFNSKQFYLALVCLLLPFSCKVHYKTFYANPAECFAKAYEIKPYDAIIVPGCPVESDTIGNVLSERIRWAVYLYKNEFTKNVIFSGSAVYSPYIEAEVMRLCALELNVPSQNIFTETKAEHTTENIYYSYKMAKEMGFKKIAFATQAVQANFMRPFVKRFKFEVDMLPVVADSINKNKIDFKLVSLKNAYVPEFISIKKRESKIKRLLGTQGHQVKVDMRKERRLKRKQNRN